MLEAEPLAPSFEKLFELRIRAKFPVHDLGMTPSGVRKFVNVAGGRIDGDSLKGEILEAGRDLVLIRSDGAFTINVELLARMDDDQSLVCIRYQGIWSIPSFDFERVMKREGDLSRPYYHRTAIFFETSAERYAWLNTILAVGLGRATRNGTTYDVFKLG